MSIPSGRYTLYKTHSGSLLFQVVPCIKWHTTRPSVSTQIRGSASPPDTCRALSDATGKPAVSYAVRAE